MSWHFLQEQEAASWEGSSLDGAPDALWRLMPTLEACFLRDSGTDCCRAFQYGTTCGHSTDCLGAEKSTLCQAGFHARTSAQPATLRGSTGRDPASGQKWPASFAKYDPALCSWKTAQQSLLEDSAEFSETWPRSGMTHGGIAYLRPNSAPHTSATGLGLLPTPTVSNGRNRTSGRKEGSQHHDGMTLLDWIWLNVGRVRRKPSFEEWMMQWPIGWTDCAPLETARFRQWQQEHGGF